MRFLFFPIFLLLFNAGYAQSTSKHITEFSQKDINNGIVIDVRTPEEFEQGHLDNAININWFDTNFARQCNTLDKDKIIYVYCKKGGRSAEAQKKLISLGFKVIDLEGGYDAIK
ncbi:rhodanese-like domain-containing protein [Maribacter sp. 2304DJ31-5]|uniref:rhodanese-like domain-containing protein n=1 Tax=Maribacter sp. 2304DJ31-5 TaxID=3386273 RepID=UPI0039BC3BDF